MHHFLNTLIMKHYLYLFSFLIIGISNAQNNGEDNLGTWFGYFGSHIVRDSITIGSVVQVRNYQPISNLQHLFLSANVNYRATPQITTGIGYGYLYADLSFQDFEGEEPLKEHRIYEQIIVKHKLWKLDFKSRFQIEQRFMDFGYKTNFEIRTRYRLQLSIPLSKVLFVAANDEILLSLREKMFDQHRLYVGLGIKFGTNYKMQIGYLRHNFTSVGFNRLQMGIYLTTDFRTKTSNLEKINAKKDNL